MGLADEQSDRSIRRVARDRGRLREALERRALLGGTAMSAGARGSPRRLRWRISAARAAAAMAACLHLLAGAQVGEGDPGNALPFNGFEVRPSLLPLDRILRGGPPRDGIPAIDKPRFVSARAAPLAPDDRVLGLRLGGVARAYPVRIMNWHEVVNDLFGEAPVVVTYCPLCGSGVAFSARVDGRRLTFGVSGLLYNSDVLLYDRETESLWSQLKSQAVTGRMIGKPLAMLPLEHTTWTHWRTRYPDTRVLSFDTGFVRDYDRDPYGGYDRDPATLFPVSGSDHRLGPKEWVVGIQINGRAKAYPFAALVRTSGTVKDRLGGAPITILYDATHRSARILDERGHDLPSVTTFWFAWAAFNPSTELFAAAPPAR